MSNHTKISDNIYLYTWARPDPAVRSHLIASDYSEISFTLNDKELRKLRDAITRHLGETD